MDSKTLKGFISGLNATPRSRQALADEVGTPVAGGAGAGAGGGAAAVDRTPALVVVSSCHSERAGKAFLEAGVSHVVAIQQDKRVTDRAAQSFTRDFYLGLAAGTQSPPATCCRRLCTCSRTDLGGCTLCCVYQAKPLLVPLSVVAPRYKPTRRATTAEPLLPRSPMRAQSSCCCQPQRQICMMYLCSSH